MSRRGVNRGGIKLRPPVVNEIDGALYALAPCEMYVRAMGDAIGQPSAVVWRHIARLAALDMLVATALGDELIRLRRGPRPLPRVRHF